MNIFLTVLDEYNNWKIKVNEKIYYDIRSNKIFKT